MTRAASIMAAVEAAIPDEAAAIRRLQEAPTDMVLREALSLTYDPLELTGVPPQLRLAPLTPSMDAVLDEEWLPFVCAIRLCARRDVGELVSRARTSPAWPFFARVLSKRFVEVPRRVANPWGTIPAFACAPIDDGDCPKTAMLVRVPVYAHRSLVVVRPPFSRPSVFVLDACGNDLGVDTRELEARAWSVEDGSPYESGLVFDGWTLGGASGFFHAFDVVPLSRFRAQTHTPDYATRLLALKQHPISRALVLSDAGSSREAMLTEPGSVFAIDTLSSYPYSSPSSWRWIRKAGGF